MTDDAIEEQISLHRAAIETLEALKRARAGGSPRTAKPLPAATRKRPAASGPRWQLAATAFRRFPFQEHTIRRICGAHPEWAMKLTGGVWHVDADKFDAFADLVEAGQVTFAVSALSAKSVAAYEQLAIGFDQQSMRESEDVK
jgi:hypothetical protein